MLQLVPLPHKLAHGQRTVSELLANHLELQLQLGALAHLNDVLVYRGLVRTALPVQDTLGVGARIRRDVNGGSLIRQSCRRMVSKLYGNRQMYSMQDQI